MKEISGAIIAVTLVLSCVFIPAAFISGITGRFYIQFALTIAGSTLISGLNSLTLSPALCVMLLKSKADHGHDEVLPRFFYILFGGGIGSALAMALFADSHFEFLFLRTIAEPFLEHGFTTHLVTLAFVGFAIGAVAGGFLKWPLNQVWNLFFALFNKSFDIGTAGYMWIVRRLIRLALVVLIVYGLLVFATVKLLTIVPVGFIPELDKGYFLISMKLPDGASLERSDALVNKVREACQKIDAIDHYIGVSGYSLVTGSTSYSSSTMICTMKPFDERIDKSKRVQSIVQELRRELAKIPEAIIAPFGAPAVDGLGRSGGFKLQVQDRGNLGPEALEVAVRKLIRAGNAQEGLIGLTTSYTASLPQLYLDIDRTQAKMLGINLSDIFQTLQIYVGSLYVNQVNLYGRTWQVNVQADSKFRLSEEQVSQLRVRTLKGDMVPLGSIVSVKRITGPEKVTRYNMFRSAEIMGGNLPTISSGQVIEMMETLAKRELPRSMNIQWTDLYYQQIKAGNTSMYVFMFAALMVFLVLAAQYESWTLPLAVVMIVPMCILCALMGVAYRWMDNNIFTQVGLLVLVGLSCKNAILIVEFAKQQREEGKSLRDATLEAAHTRLRPILMTSACFIHMVPLYFAVGAGAEMRRALGTAVLWGAFGVTLFGIFMTPVFFYCLGWATDRFKKPKPTNSVLHEPKP